MSVYTATERSGHDDPYAKVTTAIISTSLSIASLEVAIINGKVYGADPGMMRFGDSGRGT